MTARDMMKAMLDGKEVWQEDTGYRLAEDGSIELCILGRDPMEREWTPDGGASLDLIWSNRSEIMEKDSGFRFTEAVGRMARGQTCLCVFTGGIFRIDPDMGLVQQDGDGTWIEMPDLVEEELGSIWVVME